MKMVKAILAAAAVLLLGSCSRGEMGYSYSDFSEQNKVFVFYAAGASNISSYITRNIKTISQGTLPYRESAKTVLIYSHTEDSESYLRRVSADEFGEEVSDTLMSIPRGTTALDPSIMKSVLEKVLEEYPADENSFTLVLSSHGTGWLPSWAVREDDYEVGWEYAPRHKAFGPETIGGKNWDMTIRDLADALPMKIDCMVFDACLMGCVEVAYELKDKVVKLCCSPAEVPGNGYIYSNLGDDLLGDRATPESFSRAFFEHYRTALETGSPGEDSYYGATSTTVDCTKLEPLAEVCSTLFEKYRSRIAAVDASGVQEYFRTDPRLTYYPDFYDLRDILIKAGMSDDDDALLQEALDGCITYKAATSSFMKHYYGFDILTYCGLSMYLPNAGTAEIDAFYKTLAWNQVTKLVK